MEINRHNEYLRMLKKIQQPKTDIVDVIGVVSVFILSKDVFLKNKDVDEFIQRVFNLKYAAYVTKSRTLMVAKISRNLYYMDENEITSLNRRLDTYLENVLENIDLGEQKNTQIINDSTMKKKSTKKKNENEKLKVWLKGL